MPSSGSGPLARYTVLNSAFAAAYFTPERAGEPVYLDLDDDALAEVARAVDVGVDEIVGEIRQSVRSMLAIEQSGTAMFDEFSGRLSRWARRVNKGAQLDDGTLPPPPIIVLLAVFTLAAEQMGLAEEAMGDHAYYPRLYKLLDIPTSDHNRFVSDFRKVSEWYWECLAAWLEMMDGDRGLPSAYALSQRFIGLPISQALVRETERRQLRRMFEEMGLLPGSPVSQYDMDAALDQWIGQSPSPASGNLRGLWQRGGARERVVDIALVEFHSWDGVSRTSRRAEGLGGDAGQRSVRLAVQHASDLFSSRYRFAVTMPRWGSDAATQLDLELAGGATAEVSAVELSPRLDVVSFEDAGLANASALDGLIRLHAGERSVVRYPRKIVPLLLDPELNLLMETDTLASGSQAAVLVRDEADLPRRAAEIFAEIARPGFGVVPGGRSGVPDGWVLYTSVQAMSPYRGADVPGSSPLLALLPRVNVQMSLSGGFKMPGRIQRWSLLDLPELTVVADEEMNLVVELQSRALDTQAVESTQIATGVAPLVVPLGEHITSPGDYTLVLRRGSTRIQTMQVRVRSAETPDPLLWERFAPLGHMSSDPLWPIRATPTEGAPAIVEGAAVGQLIDHVLEARDDEDTAEWHQRERHSADGAIRIPPPDATSCIQTGAHHWRLPTFHGKVSGRFVVNTCTACGMTRRTPARYNDRLLQRKDTRQVPLASRTKELTPVGEGPSDWDAAIDCIFHLGLGTRADLAAIARQIDNSAIFEHEFIRAMDSLGIVDLGRNDKLEISKWEVAVTALAGLKDGGTALTGVWAPSVRERAYQSVNAEALVLNPESARTGYISADPFEIHRALGTRSDITVAPNAGAEILARLPHISSLTAALSTIPDPLVPGRHEAFSPRENSWVAAPHGITGALRRRSFSGTEYFVRISDDVAEARVRYAPMDVAKYTGAWMAGVSLLRYDSATESLRVPLGAPLPGLFERAAVLCSGVLPTREKETWSLVYSEIPSDFMNELKARLT